MLVKRLKPIPVEAVVRGYLAGSGWKEYQESQSVCGVPLPAGLKNASKLPEPIFTPAAKAAGRRARREHQLRAGRSRSSAPSWPRRSATSASRIYKAAAAFALTKGIIIADTKFEFGLDENGTLTLMDEVLTPDSSRYWPVEGYEAAFAAGQNPPSYDKQFVRDWLESRAHQRQALGQDPAGAAPAARRDRQDRRQVPGSAGAADGLMRRAAARMICAGCF